MPTQLPVSPDNQDRIAQQLTQGWAKHGIAGRDDHIAGALRDQVEKLLGSGWRCRRRATSGGTAHPAAARRGPRRRRSPTCPPPDWRGRGVRERSQSRHHLGAERPAYLHPVHQDLPGDTDIDAPPVQQQADFAVHGVAATTQHEQGEAVRPPIQHRVAAQATLMSIDQLTCDKPRAGGSHKRAAPAGAPAQAGAPSFSHREKYDLGRSAYPSKLTPITGIKDVIMLIWRGKRSSASQTLRRIWPRRARSQPSLSRLLSAFGRLRYPDGCGEPAGA
jgi:hypothetical protein